MDTKDKAKTFFSRSHDLSELPSLMNKIMETKELKNSMTFSRGSYSSNPSSPIPNSPESLIKPTLLDSSEWCFADF